MTLVPLRRRQRWLPSRQERPGRVPLLNLGFCNLMPHADLRKAYEGFEYSHTSIMYNILHKIRMKTLCQVGIKRFLQGQSMI